MSTFFRLVAGAGLILTLAACGRDDSADGADSDTAASGMHPPVSASVPPEERVQISYETGEELFNHYCIHCHGEGDGRPGTSMLAIKHGAEKSIIKGRQDLPVEYIKTVVRDGLLEMSPFKFTEISDEQLDLLAEYVRTP